MKKRMMMILLTILALCLFAACGSPMSAPDTASAPAPEMVAPEAPAVADSADFDFAEETDTDYFRFPTLTPSAAGDRRLVYHVSMRLQTTDFQPGMSALLSAVADAGGYVVSADVQGTDLRSPDAEQRADFQFRLPTEHLTEFIFVVENNFNILNLQQNMWDFTAGYQGTAWSLDDLREEENLLQDLLENAEDDERAALSDELSAIRRAIRELEAAQAAIMNDVIYSTIDVQLFEAHPPQEVTPPNMIIPLVIIAVLFLAAIVLVLVLVKRGNRTSTEESGKDV